MPITPDLFPLGVNTGHKGSMGEAQAVTTARADPDPGMPAHVGSTSNSHRIVAQRTLSQHLANCSGPLEAALAEIHPTLVSQWAPAPSCRILAAFDDIATHVLLDSLFLGFRTRKMDLGLSAMRSVPPASRALSSCSTMSPPSAGDKLGVAGEMDGLPLDDASAPNHHHHHHAHMDSVAPAESMFILPDSVVRTPNAHPVNINDLSDTIRRYVSDEISLSAATHIIINTIPWLRGWIENELPIPYIRHFCRHFQRYISIHSAMAGFDLVETTRYDSGVISTPAALADRSRGIAQAALVANRAWGPGDELLLCGGRLVSLSQAEEDDLQDRGRDFSVLLSRRSGEHNLFLGPGRFVNHDCRPNLAFVVHRTGEVHFRVLRPIAIGQELSVCYGTDYFGKANCECMCESCELTHRGWFALTSGQQRALLEQQDPLAGKDASPRSASAGDKSKAIARDHGAIGGEDDPMDVDSATSIHTASTRHDAPAASSFTLPVGSRIGHRVSSANSLRASNVPTSTPALDWLDSPFFDGDDADRNVLTAAISALSEFQRRVYIAMLGQDVHALGEPLTVPCALCQCRAYVYRISPQGHVHCHKCLRNVLLFAVPWPHRIPSAVANAATSAMVAQAVGSTSYVQQLPVHQQYAFTSSGSATTGHGPMGNLTGSTLLATATGNTSSVPASGAAAAPQKSAASKKRVTQQSSTSASHPPNNGRPAELPDDYILDEVERRLVRQVTTPILFSAHHEHTSQPTASMSEDGAVTSSVTAPDLTQLDHDCLTATDHVDHVHETNLRVAHDWASPPRPLATVSAASSLSPAESDLLHSRSAQLAKVVATPEQMAEWREVQAKLDEMHKISPKLSKFKWQFNDEGPLLVKNYNQRNLVLCLDKGIWYPAVTVPVSDWDDQKLDGDTPESFHVLFLNTSCRSYGCVHRLDMVLVTDILRGGRSLIFSDPEPLRQTPLSDQVSSSTSGTASTKQPLVMRAGRDIEVTLKSVQAAAVERLLSPPPRAVWQKWHSEYKLISGLPAGAPFTYHPVANIDMRPMAAVCRPNLVNGRGPRAQSGSKVTSRRATPDPDQDSDHLASAGGKMVSSGRRALVSAYNGSPVVKPVRGRARQSLVAVLMPTGSPTIDTLQSPMLSTSAQSLEDYVMATPKPRSPIVVPHGKAASPMCSTSQLGTVCSTSPTGVAPSAAIEVQKRAQLSPDSNEMSAMVLDHVASWHPSAVEEAAAPPPRAVTALPLEPQPHFDEPLQRSTEPPGSITHASQGQIFDCPTVDDSIAPLDHKKFSELAQMRCCIDFESEAAEGTAFSMYIASVEWLAVTGSRDLPLHAGHLSDQEMHPAPLRISLTAAPTTSSGTRKKAKRSSNEHGGSTSRRTKKPKMA